MYRQAKLVLVAFFYMVMAGCYKTPGVGQRPVETREAEARRIMDLNGTWDIAEGSMDSIPFHFLHKVP
ncbi:MAG: hypothetical protein JXM79_02830, partial [Sedimentisphaerales bacterium]|nr:hypothetical protein [Sedimentisphaerales bacterium]